MKNLIMILLCVFIVACNKKTATPVAPPPTNSTQSTVLTAQEQQLAGLWIMDSTIVYLNNVRQAAPSTIHTNSTTCRMEFLSAFQTGSTEYRQLTDGHLGCSLSNVFWKAPNTGYFNIGSVIYPITLINSACFRFTVVSGTYEYRYYLHK